MFNTVPNSKLLLSVTAGETPTLSEVAESGAHLNTADMKLYLVSAAGELETRDIDLDVVKALLGVEAAVIGRVSISSAFPMQGAYVKVNDVADIVSAGDYVMLPYGRTVLVSAVIDQNRILVNADLPTERHQNAIIQRMSVPLTQLTNPSPLSKVWDSVLLSTVPQPPSAYTSAAGNWRFFDTDAMYTDLVSEQSITAASAEPVFTDPGLTIDVNNPYLTLPFVEGTDPTETISMVVRNRGTGTGVLLGTLHSSGDGIGYGLYVNEAGPDGTASLSINNRGGYRTGDVYMLPLGEWTHLALSRTMTAESETFTLFANGVEVWTKEETADVGNYATSNKAYCIGDAYYNNEDTVDFDVLDIAFFNSALDNTQLTALYAEVKEGMEFYGVTLP